MKQASIKIDEKLLEEAMKITHSKSKKKVVEESLKLLLKLYKKKELLKSLGTYDIDITLKDLEEFK